MILEERIMAHVNRGEIEACKDMIDLIKGKEYKEIEKWNKELRWKSLRMMVDKERSIGYRNKAYEAYRSTLLISAPYDFDCFLLYMEQDRKAEKKFYAPRRHYLKPIVAGYQEILDKKIDILTISMPKRAGKSQLGINFVLLLSGRNTEGATLMEGTGESLINSFYKGLLEYLDKDNEYLYYDVFPKATIVGTSADEHTINLERKNRFPTVMCRSIDSRQVGLSEASNLLYLDDCVDGRDEGKNKIRLDEKWETISGDIIGRAIEGTPIIATGTRYSIYDPIGRIQEHAEKVGKRYRKIEIPALDPDTDESNYEYEREGNKVFTTAYFREQREMLSEEQFESEFQQQPFESKGVLFPPKDLNYYYDLPKDSAGKTKEPDTIIAVCDTAGKGTDSTSMPIGYIYGEDVYIEDVVFDNSRAEVVLPECCKKIIEHKVVSATFESNNGGEYFAKDVYNECKKMGYSFGLRTKRTLSNKQTRIEFASTNIIKHFYFKHPSLYSGGSQYGKFMREVTTYNRAGKVPHDDGPDSLSLMENEIRFIFRSNDVEIFKRVC